MSLDIIRHCTDKLVNILKISKSDFVNNSPPGVWFNFKHMQKTSKHIISYIYDNMIDWV